MKKTPRYNPQTPSGGEQPGEVHVPAGKEPLYLVNKLTVKDARHLLRHEGGEASRAEYVVQWISIALTAWLSARAIYRDGATAWHLLLPLFAQYMALLFCLPVLNAWFRLRGLRQEVRKCFVNLGFWVLAGIGTLLVRSRLHHVDFAAQWARDSAWLIASIRGHGMLWPMLSAAAGFALSLPARLRTFRDHGPPFVSVSFGCAAKIVILLLGAFLLPVVLAAPERAVWFLWVAWVTADIVALAGLWDIRRRLHRLDSGNGSRSGGQEAPPH